MGHGAQVTKRGQPILPDPRARLAQPTVWFEEWSGVWRSGPAGKRPRHSAKDAKWAGIGWVPYPMTAEACVGSWPRLLALEAGLWAGLRGGTVLGSEGTVPGPRRAAWGWQAPAQPGRCCSSEEACPHSKDVPGISSSDSTEQKCFTVQIPCRSQGQGHSPSQALTLDPLCVPRLAQVPGPPVECAGTHASAPRGVGLQGRGQSGTVTAPA